jgi:hypothetical protein
MKQIVFKSNQNPERISSHSILMIVFRLKYLVILFISASVFYLLFFTSCANIGSPTGGPKDTIPPVVVKTVPALRSTDYSGSDVRFTFDEYIQSDQVGEKLIVSPPIRKKPQIKMKGKTLIVAFPQPLRKETTYSLDFKNSIVDNDEKNPIEDFRFSFSTGPKFDSLRVSGVAKNAFTMEPVEKALVMLHRDTSYVAFIDSIPDYIGTTDKDGAFLIDNVAPGRYRLYALTDNDNSLTYNASSELIAFDDSIVVPSARYVVRNDTIIKGSDTLMVTGHTDYRPGTQYLMMFQENKFEQFLDSYKRNEANKCDFFFHESLSDSFRVNLIKPKPQTKDWMYLETNLKRDSVTVWLTDTVWSNNDSLKFQLRYQVLDSLNHLVMKNDTVEMVYTPPKTTKPKRKKSETPGVQAITFLNNINPAAHDIYRPIRLEAPEPLVSFDFSKVRLYQVIDTVKTLLPIELKRDSNSIRKYYIEQHWEPNTNYRFQVDSAAAYNIYGHPSNKVDIRFRTQKEDYYGKIILHISGLSGAAIVQLLANDKDEKILQKIEILENGIVEFPYLKPDKYKIRLILDTNKNGKWDTGYLAKDIQPEKVVYFPKVIKVRSNFEINEDWNVEYRPDYKKDLIDEDAQKDKDRKKLQGEKGQADRKRQPDRSSTGRLGN